MEFLDIDKENNPILCKKWLVIERCSGCIFETLCWYQDRVKKEISDDN